MNAISRAESLALPVRLTSPYARTIDITVYGVPMVCEYQYEKGEPCRASGPPDSWDPGYPPNVALLSCSVGGVDITEMLSNAQQEHIEDAILDALE